MHMANFSMFAVQTLGIIHYSNRISQHFVCIQWRGTYTQSLQRDDNDDIVHILHNCIRPANARTWKHTHTYRYALDRPTKHPLALTARDPQARAHGSRPNAPTHECHSRLWQQRGCAGGGTGVPQLLEFLIFRRTPATVAHTHTHTQSSNYTM